ncbi:MAG TPA: diguanylate cyclase [Acidiferrobacteraceae bacterium]|nr:diguanylate cyclase [Acidiferrobacteraceae bacterium]
MSHKRFKPSLGRAVGATLALVAAIPVAAMTAWLYVQAHAGMLREARDKNQLLSQNLAAPVGEYLSAASNGLRLLARLYDRAPQAMGAAVRTQTYFRRVLYIPAPVQPVLATPLPVLAWGPGGRQLLPLTPQLRALVQPFQAMVRSGYTGLRPWRGRPAMFFMHPVNTGLLVARLDLGPVRALCRNIHFGRHGHCVITDQFGAIVQHPNSRWVRQAKSIASWPIVAAALHGKSGVQQFYSPFLKRRMIAGYAAVPRFHWAVLTPQPRAELAAHAQELVQEGFAAGVAGVACALLIGSVLASWLMRPLRALERDMRRMRNGDLTRLFRSRGHRAPRELESLRVHSRRMAQAVRLALHLRAQVNRELEQRIQAATAELQMANRRLERESLVDELTQLGNRRMLWELVGKFEKQTDDAYLPLSVLLFDIDHFKRVNDTQGHAVGDQLLVHVARLLGGDTRDGDHVLRYAGDEFLVILTQCDLDSAWRRGEALRRAVFGQPLLTPTGALLIGLSVGVASVRKPITDASFRRLLAHADQAMYLSKRLGRNRVSRAQPQ